MDRFQIFTWLVFPSISLLFSMVLMMGTIIGMYKTIGRKQRIISYVFWMSCADIGLSVSFLLHSIFVVSGNMYNASLSIATGITFFSFATRGWYFTIGRHLVSDCIYSSMPPVKKRYLWHLYVWGTSCIIVILSFCNNMHAPSEKCYMPDKIFFWLLPEFILSLFYIGTAILVWEIICVTVTADVNENAKTLDCRILFFGLFFVITWWPMFVLDASQWMNYAKTWDKNARSILYCSSAIFNSLVWIFVFDDIRQVVINQCFKKTNSPRNVHNHSSDYEKIDSQLTLPLRPTNINGFGTHTNCSGMHTQL